MAASPPVAPPEMPIRFGVFEVDLHAGELRKSGAKVRLEGQPFQILTALLTHPGRVVTREELKKELWAAETFVDFEHSINSAVKRLREALGDSADTPRFIETLPRRGYRFIYPVESPVESSVEIRVESAAVESSQRGRASRQALFWVGVAALAIVSVAAALNVGRDRLPGTRVRLPVRSVAVLPFRNLTGHVEEEHIADGLTEELTTALDHVKQLFVPSVTSAMTYKEESKKRLPEIARDLDVDLCVDGSVQRSGNLLIVNVRLKDRTDQSVSSQSYERDSRAPHILQLLPHEIARDLVRAMRLQLSADKQEWLMEARSLDSEAYETYLQGLHQLNSGPPEERRKKAEALFLEAIAIDKGLANAYAKLALLSAHGGFYLIGGNSRDRDTTRLMARKALDLDGGLAEANAALGWVEMSDWHWSRAEDQFLLAIKKNPNLRVAHTWYGEYLSAMGRNDEAFLQADDAIHLDPAVPASVTHAAQVYMYGDGSQLDKAIGIYRQVINQQEDYWFAHQSLGEAYILKGNYQEAISELEASMRLRKGSDVNTKGLLARAYVGAGRPELARQIVADFESRAKTKGISAYGPVMAYLALRDHESALRWLEQAYENHGEMMMMLNRKAFDPIRSDSRFQNLVRLIELPHGPARTTSPVPSSAK